MHLRLLVLGLLLFSSPALAQDEPLPGHSNIDLMWACQGRGDVYTVASEKNEDAEFFGQFDVLECVAYLAGMVDMNSMVQGFGGRGFFCIPTLRGRGVYYCSSACSYPPGPWPRISTLVVTPNLQP